MRFIKRIACTCLIALAAGSCVSTARKAEKAIGLDTSEVFRLGQEALKPLADIFIQRGERVLLVPVPSRAVAWRFVPVAPLVPKAEFEKSIKTAVQSAFKTSGSTDGQAEIKQVTDAFIEETAKKGYVFEDGADGYDDRLVGRALAAAGYSGIAPFSLSEFSRLNPYFIDSLEGGMLAAVLARQAYGFERLSPAKLSAVAQAELRSGALVFGTSELDAMTWQEAMQTGKPGPSQKMLQYSIENVVTDEKGYVGFWISLRLVDMAGGGKVLWSGSKAMMSKDFPVEMEPFLHGPELVLKEDLTADDSSALAAALKDQGLKGSANAVLVKLDDISVFGSYPVTREDEAVERALEGYFGKIPGLSVVDKLYKRHYKAPWQYDNTVFNVNPFRGGDYAEFQNYYGARYMIGYRILWKDIQGTRLLDTVARAEITSRVLGIHYRVIDMGARGRIVASRFMKLAGSNDLDKSVLYRCYVQTADFEDLAAALKDAGVSGPGVNSALVNRRMEIAGLYRLGAAGASPAAPSLPSVNAVLDQKALMMAMFDAYDRVDRFDDPPEPAPAKSKGTADGSSSSGSSGSGSGSDDKLPTLKPEDERTVFAGISLMQSWFEDGLATALVSGDFNVYEKFEPFYSRTARADEERLEDKFLSPLVLGAWNQTLGKYYGIDRVIYYSLMDTRAPQVNHYKLPEGSPLARYFPLASVAPDSLQVSVVNLASGDYEFRRDFSFK